MSLSAGVLANEAEPYRAVRTAAVIAELISSNRGLGYLVQTGAMNFDTTSVFAAIAMATLLVHGVNWLMNAIEASLLRWRPPIDAVMEA